MLSVLLITATAMMAQESAANTVPEIEDKTNFILCGCAKAAAPDMILEGLVVDAEVTLAPGGRSPNERQATIFNVLKATGEDLTKAIDGRTRIFHNTTPGACGVTFDYGKRYSVAVRKTETGALETDLCLSRVDEAPSPTPTPNAIEPSKSE